MSGSGIRGRRLLLVEDEPSLVMTIRDRLAAEGYEVETADDGDQGLRMALSSTFDLVILDIMLPGKDGFEVCRELRQQGIAAPILMLTARRDVVDKVVGLKLGADDYLTKPFEMIELLARVEALLRRAGTPAGGIESYVFGEIRVDLRRSEVTRGKETVTLSALEYKLLRYFIEHRGEVLSRDTLLNEVWGYKRTPYTRTVDVHIASLRQKLEAKPSQPDLIRTIHGRGYKFTG